MDMREQFKQLMRDNLDKEYKEQATAYYKEQHELIEDQKNYTRAIHRSSIVTTVATVVMAIATVVMATTTAFQCNLTSKSNDKAKVQLSQPQNTQAQTPDTQSVPPVK
jgi:hypothetical protein